MREKLEDFEFDQAALAIYHFFWDEFCDWYLEISKIYLKNESLKKNTQVILYKVFSDCLKLLHPFIPFVTEELWSFLPFKEEENLLKVSYPKGYFYCLNEEERTLTRIVIDIITSIRNVKSEYNLVSKKDIPITLVFDKERIEKLQQEVEIIKNLSRSENFKILESYHKKEGEIMLLIEGGGELFIDLSNYLDFEKEKNRLKKEIEKSEEKLKIIQSKLSNQQFLEKAPPEIIEKEKRTFEELIQKLEKLKNLLEKLDNASS